VIRLVGFPFTSYEAETESSTDYAVNRQYSQSVGLMSPVIEWMMLLAE
jgi:hypothetical protein